MAADNANNANNANKAQRTEATQHDPINMRELHLQEAQQEGRDVKVKPEPVITIIPPEGGGNDESGN